MKILGSVDLRIYWRLKHGTYADVYVAIDSIIRLVSKSPSRQRERTTTFAHLVTAPLPGWLVPFLLKQDPLALS